MNRKSLILLGAVLFLLAGNIVYRIYAGWGLITVHAKDQPLSQVIASIQRQGHATIQTDMAPDTKVTMDVVRVPLTNALETLSVVTEGRWRLLYFVAGDRATLKTAETAWASNGQRPDGWRMVAFPNMMNNFLGGGSASDDDDGTAAPPDPRLDVWTVKTAAPAPVQTFITEAATLTDAGFAFPESWNPNVNSAPPSGEVRKAVPKLVSAAGGKVDQVFFLSKPFRRQRGPDDQGGGATADAPQQGQGGFQRPDPDAMQARVQAQIDRLPPDKKAAAQANMAFWQSLRDMDPDQRRAAIQQHMQDPDVQQQMANRDAGQDARMAHTQRLQHFQNYVNRKIAAMSKSN